MADPLRSPAGGDKAPGDDLVLSRHADVLAALREPSLRQVAPGVGSQTDEEIARREKRRLQNRADVAAAITPATVAQWRSTMGPLARRMVAELPRNREVDLMRGFLHPWCLAGGLLSIGANADLSTRLAALHAQLVSGEQAAAQTELKLIFRETGIPGGEPLFIGISDTLPRFLGNALIALLRHPAEIARLRSGRAQTPAAIDELLRYAGLVHTLAREAESDADIAGRHVCRGQRLLLKPAAANRDADVFPDPDRLDGERRAAGQLALGAGPHSCVGSSLVRVATAIMIESCVDVLATAELASEIVWRSGSMLFSPATLPVILRQSGD